MNVVSAMSEEEKIHICYTVSDTFGTYSKFAGTSLSSLLRHTSALVTVHLLHDGSLSALNVGKFQQLVNNYGAELVIYNVPEILRETMARAVEIFSRAVKEEYFTGAALYRLVLAQVLPEEVNRVIYLDADTVVTLDIRELWQEPVGENGLAATCVKDTFAHYGKDISHEPEEKIYFYMKERVTWENCFYSGLLIIDLNRFRSYGDILLPGLKFLAKYPKDCKFYDQTILNYFFAKDYHHLPWKFNILTPCDRECSRDSLLPGIYHYQGHDFHMVENSLYDRLFLQEFQRTPWCDAKFLCKGYANARKMVSDSYGKRIHILQQIFLNISPEVIRKRVVIANPADESKLKHLLRLREDEPFVYVKRQGNQVYFDLPFSGQTHWYIFYLEEYDVIRKQLERIGMRENMDFIDGRLLMPMDEDNIWDGYRWFRSI